MPASGPWRPECHLDASTGLAAARYPTDGPMAERPFLSAMPVRHTRSSISCLPPHYLLIPRSAAQPDPAGPDCLLFSRSAAQPEFSGWLSLVASRESQVPRLPVTVTTRLARFCLPGLLGRRATSARSASIGSLDGSSRRVGGCATSVAPDIRITDSRMPVPECNFAVPIATRGCSP